MQFPFLPVGVQWKVVKNVHCPTLLIGTGLMSIVGVDRLSAPILSIFTIIDIGHFQNRFVDYFFIFFIMQTNILYTGDIIYW